MNAPCLFLICSFPFHLSYEHRELETAFVQLSKAGYARQVAPTTHIPVQLGNIYTASLFSGLLSLLTQRGADLAGARILLFAYGSGLASSAYVFNVRNFSSYHSCQASFPHPCRGSLISQVRISSHSS